MGPIKDIPFSRFTVARRCEILAENIVEQLQSDIKKCEYLSIQLDESTDISHIAQLSVFVRLVFSDYTAKEEILKLHPLHGHATGEVIHEAVKVIAKEFSLPFSKITSITTDGAPAMVGNRSGFITLCQNDIDFPAFLSYHCIIHQENLCAKVIKMTHVMQVVTSITKSIRAKPLQRRLFRSLLNEVECNYGELLLYAEVRWLSRGKCLQRFRELLPEIRTFLEMRGELIQELSDKTWLLDLAFLTDITSKLNELNIKIQGAQKNISDMISEISAFQQLLQVMKFQLKTKDLKHFHNILFELQNLSMEQEDFHESDRYAALLELLETEFKTRFKDFWRLSPIVSFLSNPFTESDVAALSKSLQEIYADYSSSKFEEEIIRLRKNIFLLGKRDSENFWSFVASEEFPTLKDLALKIYSFFGSTYLSESCFSGMKIIKSKYRSRLSDSHLDDCMRLAVTKYTPEFEKIASSMQCHRSH